MISGVFKKALRLFKGESRALDRVAFKFMSNALKQTSFKQPARTLAQNALFER